MRFFVVVLTIASLTTLALAQGRGNKKHGSDQKTAAPNTKVDEKGYKAALDRMPTQKYDPWGKLRPAEDKK